jgi:hypothetical protein
MSTTTPSSGLGSRFVGALDVLFIRLVEFPRSAPLVAGYVDVRRAVVRGFSGVVFYWHRPDRLLRVLHTACGCSSTGTSCAHELLSGGALTSMYAGIWLYLLRMDG